MKDLLGLRGLDAHEIENILTTAVEMKKILVNNVKKTNHLSNKSVATLFYENSTRTRTSFEIAAKFMGAVLSSIPVAQSSVRKGETLIDTGKTLDALATDVIVIRHEVSGAPHFLAKNVKASVINGGDGMNEHPTQALLDMFTVAEEKGSLKGLKVAIIGDVKHSRVARSNLWGMSKLGAEITLCAPGTLMPKDIGLAVKNLKIEKNADEAVRGADVVMGLRLQLERMTSGLIPSVGEYNEFYGLSEKRLKGADKDVMVLHPGPINRGVEIDGDVADAKNSFIERQVTNGVAVRMAVLFLLTRS
ncbi:MAG: aspartate carbamoyltransferase catalytic subunit [Clostridiales bacterium]|jgi:aspartate carbamoyltransferase catalytic subunit|nr:aspartate carbamoyltransferase catalytic subunit [Clostridiales bacterium]